MAEDNELVSWLEKLNCDRGTVNKFVDEEYTLVDILEYVTRDDLRRLNLRYVIWKLSPLCEAVLLLEDSIITAIIIKS